MYTNGSPYILPTITTTSAVAANAVQHGSVFTENDKLPWPTTYENVERELKWKLIKPSTLHPRHFVATNLTHDSNSRTLSQQTIETTSSVSVLSTNAIPTLTTANSSPYQPYVFESIPLPPNFFPSAKIPEFSTNLPDDPFAQPIDTQNLTNSDFVLDKENLTPIQRLNKE